MKSEITIGDIGAVGALIASLIFYFGYSHTRKSEQIKIAGKVTRLNPDY